MIAIIDYDAGNLRSVEKALDHLGAAGRVTRDRKEILAADRIILPGVGSFGDAMEKLRRFDLPPVLAEAVDRQIPFLGICLGLQLLFDESEETPGEEGLHLLKGKILRIPEGPGRKVPQIGWNQLRLTGQGRLFTGIPDGTDVYFVHSYYLQAEEESIVKAVTDYGVTVHASVECGNLFGCQFHPEKSGEMGLKILKNFISL